MSPVINGLKDHPDQILSRVCVTAQHRQMLDQVLMLFGIRPDYDLDVMQQSQSPLQVAALVLQRLEPILKAEKPDWVLVQGDTTTVMSAALAAFYSGVKVGHVEAGLRTHDKSQPFPEEINRRVASVAADVHFAPTQQARTNLLREGISDDAIRVTGNTVIDALNVASRMPYDPSQGPLRHVPWDRRVVLVTAHRRENFGYPLEQICLALRDLAQRYSDSLQIVYPVHLNPNIQDPTRRILSDVPNISLTEPLDYLPLIYLMRQSTFVLTDSGGIQEEAPSLGKPVLVLREVTERPEAVEAGTVRIVGTNRMRILTAACELLEDAKEYQRMAHAVNPYGDGHAAERIVWTMLGKEMQPFLACAG